MTDAVIVTMSPVTNEKLGISIMQLIVEPDGNTHEIKGEDQDCSYSDMELKRLGNANPYPNSYNPENTKIEPTA